MKASSIKGLKARVNMFGAEVLAGPDGNGVQIRSGNFDDGRAWTVPEVEVVDSARNKTVWRFLPDMPYLAPGLYDLTCEIAATPKGATAIEVVHAAPIEERNGKAGLTAAASSTKS